MCAECYPWPEKAIAELRRQNIEVGRAFIEKVPEICVKLGRNPIDQAGRAHKSNRAGAMERAPQKPVKTIEVIHMSVRDENVSHAQQLARRKLLQIAKQQGLTTKTGMMLGLGEEEHEIEMVIDDLVAIGVDILTLGQYLQPTVKHLAVERWVHPDEFVAWKSRGETKGLRHVESGPLVRSSYHAEKQVMAYSER